MSGNVGYNVMEQDDPLLPYTLNTALVGIDHETGATFDPTLPAQPPREQRRRRGQGVEPRSQRRHGPRRDWTFKLVYRYYDYDNHTPRTVFAGYVRFHADWTPDPRITVPYAFTRDDLGAEVEWDLSDRTGFGLSYHRKSWEREFREVEDSDEDVVKLSFDSRLGERFTVRASYELGDRTIDGYLVEAQMFSFFEPTPINNQPGLRKYDEAARDYDDWEASVFILLTDAWNLNLGVSGRDEDYDESQFGLIDDDILQLSADLSYSPGEDLTFFAFAHLGDRETFQRARQSGGTLSTNPPTTGRSTSTRRPTPRGSASTDRPPIASSGTSAGTGRAPTATPTSRRLRAEPAGRTRRESRSTSTTTRTSSCWRWRCSSTTSSTRASTWGSSTATRTTPSTASTCRG